MENEEITFAEAWELWERIKHRPADGFVPDTSVRIEQLYKQVPAIMRLLERQHMELENGK